MDNRPDGGRRSLTRVKGSEAHIRTFSSFGDLKRLPRQTGTPVVPSGPMAGLPVPAAHDPGRSDIHWDCKGHPVINCPENRPDLVGQWLVSCRRLLFENWSTKSQ